MDFIYKSTPIGDQVIDYDETGYYVFSDQVAKSRISATVGITYQTKKWLHFYAGAGFGMSKLLWEIKQHNYEDDKVYQKSYVKHQDFVISSFELEGGIILELGDIGISVGATTLGLKKSSVTFGVGYFF